MNKYPKYKETNIDWLGEIPEHWEIKRIKFLFDEINEKSFDENEELLSVSQYTGVTKKADKVKDGDLLTNAQSLEGYKKVDKGDLVSNIMLAWNGSLGFSNFKGITSPAYAVYRLKTQSINKFFHYLFRTNFYKAEFKRNSSGVIESRLRLYTDDFFRIFAIYPPLPEQKAIASFLDEKTKKIDLAISQKQKMIALLKERKQIIIQKAVTGKLRMENGKWKMNNSQLSTINYPLKNSGIEWIGDIPEHWEVKALKNIANVTLGKMLCNNDKGGYQLKPYLKSKNIQWLKIDISSVDEMWFSKKEMKEYLLKKGDLILSEGGEVGKTCIWNNELEECYIQNSAHKVNFTNGNSKYYLYLFFYLGKIGFFDSIVNRVSIAHLTKEKLINIRILVPPLSEQKAIVKYIEEEMGKMDKAIGLQEKQIEKLKEYKQILIDNAVRGKICIYFKQHKTPKYSS